MNRIGFIFLLIFWLIIIGPVTINAADTVKELLIELNEIENDIRTGRELKSKNKTSIGSRIHELHCQIWESMANQEDSDTAIIKRPRTFIGKEGAHVFGIGEINGVYIDDNGEPKRGKIPRIEVWIEKYVGNEGYTRADRVTIDHENNKIIVSDNTSNHWDDPIFKCGEKFPKNPAHSHALDHGADNIARTYDLREQVHGLGFEEYDVYDQREQNGEFYNTAIRKIIKEQNKKTKKKSQKFKKLKRTRIGPTKAFVGGLVINAIIQFMFGQNVYAGTPDDGAKTLAMIMRAYLKGNVQYGDSLRRNKWGGGWGDPNHAVEGPKYVHDIAPDAGVANFILEMINKRLDMLRKAGLKIAKQNAKSREQKKPKPHEPFPFEKITNNTRMYIETIQRPGFTLLTGEDISFAVRVFAAIDGYWVIVSDAPVEVDMNEKKGVLSLKTDKMGTVSGRSKIAATPGLNKYKIYIPGRDACSEFMVKGYDYVVRKHFSQSTTPTGHANGKTPVKLKLVLKKRYSSPDGKYIYLPPTDYKDDFQNVTLQGNLLKLGKTRENFDNVITFEPVEDNGIIEAFAISHEVGTHTLETDLRGGKFHAVYVKAGNFPIKFQKHAPGLMLVWGDDMKPWQKNGRVVLPETEEGSTKKYFLDIKAVSKINGSITPVPGVKVRFNITPNKGVSLGGGLSTTVNSGKAMFNNRAPFIWGPKAGKNQIEISAEGSSNRLHAEITGVQRELLDFELLETIIVPTNRSSVVSKTRLIKGITYKLRASGSFSIGGPGYGDAEYAYNPSFTVVIKNCYDSQNGTDLGLGINDDTIDNKKFPYWGKFNPAHIYIKDFVGQGKPITLNYHDCNYGDNSGSLKIEIFAPK